MKILYFFISSHLFGKGHQVRAENYQQEFKKYKNKIKLINIVNKKNKLIYDFKKISKEICKNQIILFDVSNRFFFNNPTNAKNLEKIFKLYSNKIVIIDGLKKEIISNKFRYKYKAIIVPYIFDKKLLKKIKDVQYFIGIKYFITKRYLSLKKINFSKKKNILFTSGGSDKENSTLKFLKIFNLINSDLVNLFILIGPNFKNSNINLIKTFCKKKRLNVKFLKFKKNIYKNVFNKDIVITSSGLTKYELIQSKKPFIVFPENDEQKKVDEKFKRVFSKFYLDDLSCCKKNSIRLNKMINSKMNIKNYYNITKNMQMNDFKSIYNFIKNDI